jgi:hypothetical protein
MLVTKFDLVVSTNVNVSFHALVCRQVLFSLGDITTHLPHLRGIEHQIDLIPDASLANRVAYRTSPEETKEIQRQVQELLDNGYVRESLSPCDVPVILVPKKNGT